MNDLTHYEYTDRKGNIHLVDNLPPGANFSPSVKEFFGLHLVLDSTMPPGTAEFRDPQSGKVLARVKAE